MSNDKDFKVKNGVKPTVYHEKLGTVVSGPGGAYDLAVVSYDGVSFSVAAQETFPYGLFFKPDGTKMYVTGQAGDDINEYNLSTAWNISTASFVQVFSVAAQDGTPIDIFFRPDGTKMYMLGFNNGSIYEYNLSTAWNISTASYVQNFSIVAQESNPRGVFFKPDGTKMYVVGFVGDDINEYNLSTAWNISTASYVQNFSVATQDNQPIGIFFKPDGLRMYVVGGSDQDVNQYALSTAWDVSTASYVQNFSFAAQGLSPTSVQFKSDGTKMYALDLTNDAIYQYSITATQTLDLSTGSVFQLAPTSNIQLSLSNPAASGTVSGATLLLEGTDPSGVSPVFSTSLYRGNGTNQTITNGIDLAGEGGLVWIKPRSDAGNHYLYDTVRGTTKSLITNSTAQQSTLSTSLTAFNANGFSLGASTVVNNNGTTYASWNFRKAPRFFDVVTFTSVSSTNLRVSHNLGIAPGLIILKNVNRNDTSGWYVYHRSLGRSSYGTLNTVSAFGGSTNMWGTSDPTPTDFGINSSSFLYTGDTYVAYLFAHDPLGPSGDGSDGLIACGSYTGNGSSTGPVITLGWEPQWLLVKGNISGTDGWHIFDATRGLTLGGVDAKLLAETSASEVVNANDIYTTATGFRLETANPWVNNSGTNYIYTAIKDFSTPTITYDSSIDFPGNIAPTSPAFGQTDVLVFTTRDGGTSYKAALAIDGAA